MQGFQKPGTAKRIYGRKERIKKTYKTKNGL
jgi:hypothetical protein